MINKLNNKEELENLYLKQNLSAVEIAKYFGVVPRSVYQALRRFGIPRRHKNSDSINWDEANLEELYWKRGLSRRKIGEMFGVSKSAVQSAMKSRNIPARSRQEAVKLAAVYGEENQTWKGGRFTSKDGYVYVYARGHPRAREDRYVLEHILIWERVHNRPLPSGWVVHHLNGIRSDNRPENLVALPNQKHMHILRAKGKRIRELEAKVKLLERVLDEKQMVFNFKDKGGDLDSSNHRHS